MAYIGTMVFGKESCRYCQLAKELLESKSIPYHYIDIEKEPGEKDNMVQFVYEACGDWVSTVPQIFIDGEYIGGYEDLKAFQEGADPISPEDFDIGEL